MPLLPPLVLEVGSGSKFQLLPHFHIVRPSSGSTKKLGSALIIVVKNWPNDPHVEDNYNLMEKHNLFEELEVNGD